ncbi:MAG TPA: helix-turn-helix domain-containing protein [Candidatus Cloacimonadota bacterium]|nr:helix-turn-helix domain-containing protein [Candidatus Cloacimonadota bacterium]
MIDISKSYRPDQVAKMLEISERQVYRLVNDPLDPLPAIKLSKSVRAHIRIPGKDLQEWVERHKMEPWK